MMNGHETITVDNLREENERLRADWLKVVKANSEVAQVNISLLTSIMEYCAELNAALDDNVHATTPTARVVEMLTAALKQAGMR